MSNWKERQERKAIANTRYLFRGSSHCSSPRLHLREGFPLSTEDAYNGLPKTRAPSSTTYKELYRRVIFHKNKKNTSNQSDHNKITQLLTNSLFYNFLIEWVGNFSSKKCSEKNSVVEWYLLTNTTEKQAQERMENGELKNFSSLLKTLKT